MQQNGDEDTDGESFLEEFMCVSFPWLCVNLKQEGSSRRTVVETSVVLPLCSVAELCIRWEHKAERAVHLAAGKQKQRVRDQSPNSPCINVPLSVT